MSAPYWEIRQRALWLLACPDAPGTHWPEKQNMAHDALELLERVKNLEEQNTRLGDAVETLITDDTVIELLNDNASQAALAPTRSDAGANETEEGER